MANFVLAKWMETMVPGCIYVLTLKQNHLQKKQSGTGYQKKDQPTTYSVSSPTRDKADELCGETTVESREREQVRNFGETIAHSAFYSFLWHLLTSFFFYLLLSAKGHHDRDLQPLVHAVPIQCSPRLCQFLVCPMSLDLTFSINNTKSPWLRQNVGDRHGELWTGHLDGKAT